MSVARVQPFAVKQVHVGGAERHGQHSLFTDRRAQRALRGDEPYCELAVYGVSAFEIRREVERAANPARSGGRGGSFADFRSAEMRGVECREEAQQMVHVVERHAVNGDIVVRGFAALNVDAAAIFRIGLYARHRLRVVHDVGIAQYLRQLVHQAHVPHGAAVGFQFHFRRMPPCPHHGAIKRDTLCIAFHLRKGRVESRYTEYHANQDF